MAKSGVKKEEGSSVSGPIKTHLVVMFSISTLTRQTEIPIISFLHRDELNRWAKGVAPFFPGASNQELVSLALLPEKVVDAITACLGKRGRMLMPHMKVEAQYSALDESSSLMSITSLAFEDLTQKPAAKRLKKAIEALKRQLGAVFPFAIGMPLELARQEASGLGAAGLALYEAAQIKASVDEAKKPKPKPRATTI